MNKATIATLVAFVFVTLMIYQGVFSETQSVAWAAVVGLAGGAAVTGVCRFIYGKVRESLGHFDD